IRRFDLAADIGTPGNQLRWLFAASGKIGKLIAGDPGFSLPRLRGRVGEGEHDSSAASLARRPPLQTGEVKNDLVIAADEEALPLRDAQSNLIVSALALQFVNDLP